MHFLNANKNTIIKMGVEKVVTRSLELAMLLTEDKRFYSYHELSVRFGVSERLIRYEVNNLQKWLDELSLSPIEQNRNSGIRLNLTKEEVQRFNQIVYDK